VTDRVQPEIYSLLRQSPRPSAVQDVVLRTGVGPAQIAEPLRKLVREVAPHATIGTVGTMDDRIARSLARPRLYAVLIGAFAAAAMIVAVVGLVGVLSYTVSQRTREFALRMALGAVPRQIAALVLSQALTVTLSGVAIGLVAASLAARFLASLIYGVSPYDPLSFVGAPAILVLLALAACAAPSIRAVRVETLKNLRG
jgi:putative ABC transport system permease protein